jgi:hypothetical protein
VRLNGRPPVGQFNDLPLLVAVLAGVLASGAFCALIAALCATRISPIVALRD